MRLKLLTLEKSQINLDFYSLIRNFVPMKLSVIIPVYCVEATLDRCVKSVLSQHVDNIRE